MLDLINYVILTAFYMINSSVNQLLYLNSLTRYNHEYISNIRKALLENALKTVLYTL